MVLSSGSKLGPYEIVSPIGEGGMVEVFRARHTRLDRTVAIKVSKAAFGERFTRVRGRDAGGAHREERDSPRRNAEVRDAARRCARPRIGDGWSPTLPLLFYGASALPKPRLFKSSGRVRRDPLGAFRESESQNVVENPD